VIDPFDNLRRSLCGAGPIPRPPSLTGTAPPGGLAPESPPRHSLESLFADPTNLPARALAILGEMERTKWPSPPTRLQLQRHTLAGGEVCSLPIRYFDARCLIATFRTDLDRAAALLKGVGLDAVADGDGRATVWFGCFEYRDTDLGPYNEVGLGVLSRANGDRDPALYVLHLPVTTAKTDRIGRELWGYPKFVAAIILRGDDRAFSTTLSEAATGTIAVFEGGFGPAVPSPPCDLPTYSVLDSRVLRTRMQVLTPFREGDGTGFSLTVGASRHPMAKSLGALGLDGARPTSVRYADPFQGFLFPGFDV
jgi:hypothetical protein